MIQGKHFFLPSSDKYRVWIFQALYSTLKKYWHTVHIFFFNFLPPYNYKLIFHWDFIWSTNWQIIVKILSKKINLKCGVHLHSAPCMNTSHQLRLLVCWGRSLLELHRIYGPFFLAKELKLSQTGWTTSVSSFFIRSLATYTEKHLRLYFDWPIQPWILLNLNNSIVALNSCLGPLTCVVTASNIQYYMYILFVFYLLPFKILLL